jgi:hypothetical protein
MFYIYNTLTQKVEKVSKIDPSIHFHRFTKLPFEGMALEEVKVVAK